MSAEANTPSLVTRLVRFVKDDRGSVTIEFTLLLPLFTAFLLLVTDASLLFLRQITLMNVARDTARAVSRYAMTAAEAKTYAETVAKTGQGAATATVTIANGIVTVNVTTSAKSAAPFGIVRFAVGDNLSGTATSTMEPI